MIRSDKRYRIIRRNAKRRMMTAYRTFSRVAAEMASLPDDLK
jgi:hypothetical protein